MRAKRVRLQLILESFVRLRRRVVFREKRTRVCNYYRAQKRLLMNYANIQLEIMHYMPDNVRPQISTISLLYSLSKNIGKLTIA